MGRRKGTSNPLYTVEIDTHIRDIKDEIKKYEKDLNRLKQKTNKMDFGEELEKKIQEGIDKLHELQKEYEDSIAKFANQKVDTSKLDEFAKSIESRMDEVSERITQVEQDILDLSEKMKSFKGAEEMQKQIKSLREGFSSFKRDIKGAIEIFSKFQDLMTESNSKDNLRDILRTIKQLEKINFTNAFSGRVNANQLDNIEKQLESTLGKYEELKNKLTDKNAKKSPTQAKAMREQMASMLSQMQDQILKIVKIKGIDLKSIWESAYQIGSDKTPLGELAQRIDSEASGLMNGLNKRAKMIKERIDNIASTAASSFEFKDGGIRVPVLLDESSKKIMEGDINKLVSDLSKYAEEHPVNVTLRLFPLKANKEEQKDITKYLGDIRTDIEKKAPDELKEKLNGFVDKFAEQYQKNLELNIKVGLSKTAADVQRDIDAIKRAVKNTKIEVIPRFKIQKKETDRIMKQVQKNVKGDITVDLTKKLKDLSEDLNKLLDSGNMTQWGNTFSSTLKNLKDQLSDMKDLVDPLLQLTSKKKQGHVGAPTKEERENVSYIESFTKALDSLNRALSIYEKKELTTDKDAKNIVEQLQESIDTAGYEISVPVSPNTDGFIQELEDSIGRVTVDIDIGDINASGINIVGGGGGGIPVHTNGSSNPAINIPQDSLDNDEVPQGFTKKKVHVERKTSTSEDEDVGKLNELLEDYKFDKSGSKRSDEEKKAYETFKNIITEYKHDLGKLGSYSNTIANLNPDTIEDDKKRKRATERLQNAQENLDKLQASIIERQKKHPFLNEIEFGKMSKGKYDRLFDEYLSERKIQRTSRRDPLVFLESLGAEVAKYKDFKKEDKAALKDIVSRYIDYKDAGGIGSLADLTGRSNVLKKLRAEYDRQTGKSKFKIYDEDIIDNLYRAFVSKKYEKKSDEQLAKRSERLGKFKQQLEESKKTSSKDYEKDYNDLIKSSEKEFTNAFNKFFDLQEKEKSKDEDIKKKATIDLGKFLKDNPNFLKFKNQKKEDIDFNNELQSYVESKGYQKKSDEIYGVLKYLRTSKRKFESYSEENATNEFTNAFNEFFELRDVKTKSNRKNVRKKAIADFNKLIEKFPIFSEYGNKEKGSINFDKQLENYLKEQAEVFEESAKSLDEGIEAFKQNYGVSDEFFNNLSKRTDKKLQEMSRGAIASSVRKDSIDKVDRELKAIDFEVQERKRKVELDQKRAKEKEKIRKRNAKIRETMAAEEAKRSKEAEELENRSAKEKQDAANDVLKKAKEKDKRYDRRAQRKVNRKKEMEQYVEELPDKLFKEAAEYAATLNKDNFSLRHKTKKNYIFDRYEKYKKSGGTKSLYDLTDDPYVQQKLVEGWQKRTGEAQKQNHFQGLIDRISAIDEEKVKLEDLKNVYKEYLDLVDKLPFAGGEGGGAPLYGVYDSDDEIFNFISRNLSKFGLKFNEDKGDFTKRGGKFGFQDDDAERVNNLQKEAEAEAEVAEKKRKSNEEKKKGVNVNKETSQSSEVNTKQYLTEKNAIEGFTNAYDKYFELHEKMNSENEKTKNKAQTNMDKLLKQFPTLKDIGDKKKEDINFDEQLESFMNTQVNIRGVSDNTKDVNDNTDAQEKNKKAKEANAKTSSTNEEDTKNIKDNTKQTEANADAHDKNADAIKNSATQYLKEENAIEGFTKSYNKYFDLREKLDSDDEKEKNQAKKAIDKIYRKFPTIKDIGDKKKEEVNYDEQLKKFMGTQNAAKEWGEKWASDIKATEPMAEEAGAGVASATEAGARKAAEIESPSKVAERLGEFWGIGWKEGLEKTKPEIIAAVTDLMDAAKAAAKNIEPLTEDDLKDALVNFGKEPEKWGDYDALRSPLRKVLNIPRKVKTKDIEKYFEEQEKASGQNSKNKIQTKEQKISQAERELHKAINRLNNNDELSDKQLSRTDATFDKWLKNLQELGEDVSDFRDDYNTARKKFNKIVDENADISSGKEQAEKAPKQKKASEEKKTSKTKEDKEEKADIEKLKKSQISASKVQLTKVLDKFEKNEVKTLEQFNRLDQLFNYHSEKLMEAGKEGEINGAVEKFKNTRDKIIADLLKPIAEKYLGEGEEFNVKESVRRVENKAGNRLYKSYRLQGKNGYVTVDPFGNLIGNDKKIDNSFSDAKQAQQEADRLRKESQQAQQEADRAKDELDKYNQKIANDEARREFEAEKKEADRLAAEYDKKQKEVEKLKQDVEQAKREANEAKDKFEESQRKMADDEARRDFESEKKEADRLAAEYDKKQKASERLEQEVEQAKREAENAKHELEDAKRKIANDEAKRDFEAEKKEADRLVAEYERKQKESERLGKEADEAQRRADEAKDKLEESQRRMANDEEFRQFKADKKEADKLASDYDKQFEKTSKEKYNQLGDKVKEYIKLTKDAAMGKGLDEDIDKIQRLEVEIEKLTNELRESAYANSDFEKEARKGLDTLYDDVKRIEANNQRTRTSRFDSLQKKLKSESFDIGFEKEYGNHIDSFDAKLDEIQEKIRLINETDISVVEQEDIDKAEALLEEIRQIRKSGNLTANKQANENSIQKALTQINSILTGNTKSKFRKTSVYKDFVELQKVFKNFDTSDAQSEVAKFTTKLLKAKAEFEELDETYKGGGFITNFAHRLSDMNAKFFAQYFSFQDIIRYARTAFSTIRELDTALVDLRKTTSMNTQELNDFYRSSTDVGKQLGVTSQQIIQQAADWSRLGYSTREEATTMAELSSMFASVSPGMSTENSTDYLVSTMKAFGIETDEVQRKIVDNVNKIGNTFATTNAEIGEMLTRSSAAMHEANNTLEQTIALESAAVQITRNAETTGTAFRTVSMRIRGLDEETEELSEDLANISGDLADLTKIDGKGGISVFTDATKTTYKSTYQILKEIAAIWDKLSDKQHADILEKIAGKRGGQVIAGILNDFSEVERALQNMDEAAGSAESEMGIIRESLDFKVNALKQTWIGVLQDLVDKGTLGDIIDGLTNISEVIADIVSNAGLLKTAIAGIVAVSSFKSLGKDGVLGHGILEMFKTKQITTVSQDKLDLISQSQNADFLRQVQEVGIADKEIIEGLAQTYEATFNEKIHPSMVEHAVDWMNAQNGAKKTEDIVQDYGAETKTVFNGINVGLADITKGFLSLGKVIATTFGKMALSAIMSWLVSEVISFGKEVYEELSGKAEEKRTTDAIESSNEKTNKYIAESKDIENATEKYKELNKEMNSNNISSERMIEIKGELRKLQDELVDTYTTEAENINLVTGKYEEQLNVLQRLDAQKAQDYLYNPENGIMNSKQYDMTWFDKLGKYIGFNPDLSNIIGKAPTELGRVLEYINSIQDKAVGLDSSIEDLGIDLSILDKYDTLSVGSYTVGSSVQDIFRVSGSKEEINKQLTQFFSELNTLYPNNPEVQKFISNVSSINFGYDKELMDESLSTAYKALDAQLLTLTISDLDTNNDYGAQLKQRALDAVKEYNDALTEYELDTSDKNLEVLEQKKEQLFDVKGDVQKFRDSYGDLLGDLAPIYERMFDEIWDGVTLSTSEQIDKYLSDRLKDVDYSSVIEGLSDAERDAFKDIITSDTWKNAKELTSNEFYDIVNEAKKIAEENPISLNIKTSFPKSMFEDFTTALSEQKEQGYLTAETLEKLQDTYSDLGKTINKTYERNISALDLERDKISEYGVEKYRSQIESKTVPTKFGNIDMDNRQIINYDKVYLENHKKALESWKWTDEDGRVIGNYYKDLSKAIANGEKVIDTVFGGVETFTGFDNKEYDIAFSPILQTENGAEMLSSDTVFDYIQSVLNKAGEDGQITADEIFTIDATDTGKEYGKEFGLGLIAGVNGVIDQEGTIIPEVGELMHFSGKYGAWQLAENSNEKTTYMAEYSRQAQELYTFTENGILLNTEAMSKYADQTAKAALVANELKEALAVKEYNKEAKALKALVRTDKDLAKAYAKGKDELKKYLNTTKNFNQAKKDEILASLDRLGTLADEINSYDMMEAQIRAATSALHDYIEATETPNLSDNFNTAKTAVESLKTAFTNGWTGTDDFRKGMEYIGGYDFDPDIMEFASGKYQSNWAEVVEEYIKRGERYFTEDIQGIYNFLDDAVAKTEGMVTKSAEGIYSINVDNIDEFAKEMDTSVSAAMDLLLAASDAWDFDVDFSNISDGIVDGLDAIGEESTAARTDMEKFREEIELLEQAGHDVSDLWTAYDEANERIHPSIEFNAELSEKSYGELLDEAEEYAKEVGLAIGETKVSFDVDLQGTNELISKVTEYRDGLAEGNSEYEHAQTVLAALLQQKHELEKPAILNIDSSELEGETAGALNLLQEFYDAYSDYETKLTLGADTTDAEEKLNNVKQKLEGISSETAGQLGLGTIDFTADTSDIVEQLGKIDVDSIVGKNDTLEVKADTSGAKRDINKLVNDIRHTNAKISVNGITKSSGFDSVVQSTLNATTYKIKVSPYATGTVQGLSINTRTGNSKTPAGTTPYIPNGGKASGSLGVPKTGNALVGELGQELVARDGQVFLVGQDGAEIIPLQKGDIVFNAEQTKQLLATHKINSQGQIVGSFASGSQVHGGGSGGAAGSSGWTKKKNNTGSSSNSGGNNGGNSSDPSDEAEETKETFDWIEVKIQRIEEEITRLDERVENTYDIWSNRNRNLISEMESVREEIKIQQAGYERYLREADSVGLSEEYARKVRDGLIDIETIKNNEELVEQINLYQQWYNKAVECSDAVQTLTIRLGELSETNFNNLKTEFEETLSYFESYSNLIDERINRTEEKGYFVSKKYYEDLIGYEKQSLDTLRREYDGLVQRRNEAVASGTIAENSEAWHNMNQEILGVAKSIEEAATQLVTFDNKMRQIDWDVFDYTRDRIDFINDEFEFLIDLLDNQKLYDDWGIFNERGWSDTLLHASKYNIYMQESIEYAKERAKIEKQLASDPANKTLIERREELIKLQQQSIQNSYAEKEAVKSLVEEGINIHLQKLSEVIEEYKRAINDAKSLYDYQKNIAKQTKNLTDLEKQLNAYAGDDSEEARATIQKLQKSLSEAQDELKETEWDKYISETETFLDDMYTEYSEVLNARLDDIDALMHDMIDQANLRADEIKKTVETVSDEVGYDLTSSVEKLLGVTETTKMVSDFKTRFDTYATTTQALMNEIKNYIASIANKQTQPAIEPKKIENDMKNVKPAQTPIKQNVAPVNTNTNANANKGSGNGNGSGNNSTGGDGKPNVGDRVKFMSGRYYQDSYGDGRSGNQYLGGEVYITKINTSGTKPYHISTGNRLGNGDLGWVTLSQLQGYKTGNHYTDDEWAWTQEEGQEMIYRASDGALLTPLDAGGKVFTHEMTDNLWDIAQYKPTPIIPNGGNAAKTITNNNAVNINLPNVQNYEQFKTALQNDPKMTQFIQQITLGEATNGIKLNKKRF